MPGKIVSRDEWLTARKELLAQEKDAVRAHDKLRAQMRDFPMVRIDKSYSFDGPNGPVSLADLFEGHRQLVVYHFMLGLDKTEGCSGCSFLVDNLPHLSHLRFRDTAFAAVSRASMATITAFKTRMAWTFPWYSSHGSDFNYDFHVTLDEAVAPPQYNYKDKAALLRSNQPYLSESDLPGLSVFYRDAVDGDIFHSYSTYARGLEELLVTYKILDMTPLGRQEEAPGSKMEFRLHDEY